MKTKNVSIVLLSLIVLSACGSKNSRNLTENQNNFAKNQGKFFDPTTAEVINTITTNSSVGKTQLIVVAGNPQDAVSLQQVGHMNYQLKEVDYEKGEKGIPEPKIKLISSEESFPVYFVGKNEDLTTLVAVAPKALTANLTSTSFKNERLDYQFAWETRCVVYEGKGGYVSGMKVQCKIDEEICKTLLGYPPRSNFVNNPSFDCIESATGYTKSLSVSNTLDSDSLIVAINPEQSTIEFRTKVKRNNKMVTTPSMITFQENTLTFKLGNQNKTQ